MPNNRDKKNSNGLFLRGKKWHIDKIINGKRICQGPGTADYATAERFLSKLIGEEYEAHSFGRRIDRTFREAATYYLTSNHNKKSPGDDERLLKQLLAHETLPETPIAKLHRGSLDSFVAKRKGAANCTTPRLVFVCTT